MIAQEVDYDTVIKFVDKPKAERFIDRASAFLAAAKRVIQS